MVNVFNKKPHSFEHIFIENSEKLGTPFASTVGVERRLE